MQAACIAVQEATPTIIAFWNLPSRPTTPFVRNLANGQPATIVCIGTPSRDVVVNTVSFWSAQGVGAFDADPGWENDKAGDHGCSGIVRGNVFLIFNETMRDIVNTNPSVQRTVPELQQLVAFHEVLHLFGLVDHSNPNNLADGPIMTSDWHTSPNLNGYTTLNEHQIRKIQNRDYPRYP